MSRGRSPAKADDSAILALARIEAYMHENVLSATALARLIQASPSSVLRALGDKPPRWTKTFAKLDRFVNLQTVQIIETAQPLSEQIRRLQMGGAPASANATAALLRAVADLLENRS